MIKAQRLGRTCGRVADRAREHDIDGMQLVGEGHNDSEIAPAPTHGPEEVLMLFEAHRTQLAIGGHDVH